MKNLPLLLHTPHNGVKAKVLIPIGNIHSIRETLNKDDVDKGIRSRVFFLGDDEGYVSVTETIEEIAKIYMKCYEYVQFEKNKARKAFDKDAFTNTGSDRT